MVGNRRKVYIESLIHISLNLNPLGFCILFIALSQRHGTLIRVCRIFLFWRRWRDLPRPASPRRRCGAQIIKLERVCARTSEPSADCSASVARRRNKAQSAEIPRISQLAGSRVPTDSPFHQQAKKTPRGQAVGF